MAKKTNLVKVLTALMVSAIAAGAGVANLSASAEGKTLGGVNVSSFRMEYGASVRCNAEDGKNGIRFKATLSDVAYSALEALEETEGTKVNYGVMIVPADLYSAEDLTVQKIFGSGKYCLENKAECSCEKIHIASVKYDELADDNVGDGLKNLRGSLTDILPSNLTREFTGIGYIEYVTATGVNYVMAEHAFDENGEGEASIKNNTRSMTYVAQKAIVAGEDNAEQTLYNDYVSSLTNKEYKYTVNHYLPDENGEYGDPVSETAYGYLNSNVTAVNIAKSSLPNKADYASYATYGVATTSNSTDIVYANGRTVLNNYYVARNTVLFDGNSAEDFEVLQVAYDKSYEAGNMKAEAVLSQGETYTDANGVSKSGLTKIVLDGEQETYGAGYLKLAIADEKIELANSANWDYLTVTMCIETNCGLTSFNMYNKNAPLGSVNVNEWVDFVIPKASLNTSKSYFGTNFGTKEAVDQAFSNWYSLSKQDNQKNYTHNLFYTNSKANTQAGTYVNYYIEKITWGVDVQEAEISVPDISLVYAGEFNPNVTVTDDYNANPTVIKTVYSVDADGEKSEVAKNANGVWDVTAGDYVLKVEVNDSAVSDVPGNISTREIPFKVVNKTNIPGTVTAFDIPSETSHLAATMNSNVTPVISWKNEYEGRTGVAVYKSTTPSGANYGGYFYLNFSEEVATEIVNAYLDENTTFSFTITMRVEIDAVGGDYATNGVSLYFGKKYSYAYTNTKYEKDVWNEFTFTEDQLAVMMSGDGKTPSNTGADFKKKLMGGTYLFYLGWPTLSKNANITYYVDSISYTTVAK